MSDLEEPSIVKHRPSGLVNVLLRPVDLAPLKLLFTLLS